MQSMTTTRGKLRGGRQSARGRNPMPAAGQLGRVNEGESSVGAGQPVFVGKEGKVGHGSLAEEEVRAAEGSSSVVGLQDVRSCERRFDGLLVTNYTSGSSRSGDDDGGQRVWPSASKDPEAGRRLANSFFTVPL